MATEKDLIKFANEWHKIMEACSFSEVIDKRHSRLLKWIVRKLRPRMTLKEFHRKIDLTFTCLSCGKKKTEKVCYSRRKQKRHCKDCSGSAYFRKIHPEYMTNYNRLHPKKSRLEPVAGFVGDKAGLGEWFYNNLAQKEN